MDWWNLDKFVKEFDYESLDFYGRWLELEGGFY